MDFAEARRVVAAFERHQVAYVVVGSMAMAAQGIVRATRDMDVFVAPDGPNVDRLRAALRALFDDPAVESITAEDLAGDYPAIQYVPPHADYWIDILSRLGRRFSSPISKRKCSTSTVFRSGRRQRACCTE